MSTTKDTTGTDTKTEGFSAAEKAAMKERAKEAKAEARRARSKADGEHDVLAKIAEMPESDRVIATRIHEIVKATAPELSSKTWYGMPAYTRDGKNICFFQPAAKFSARYGTLGFEDSANLDDGSMWPTSFAIAEMNDAVEAQIIDLLKKALS